MFISTVHACRFSSFVQVSTWEYEILLQSVPSLFWIPPRTLVAWMSDHLPFTQMSLKPFFQVSILPFSDWLASTRSFPKCTSSFVFPLHPSVRPIHWVFIFFTLVFSSKGFIHTWPLKKFQDICFLSLSDSSTLRVTSMVSFPCHLRGEVYGSYHEKLLLLPGYFAWCKTLDYV